VLRTNGYIHADNWVGANVGTVNQAFLGATGPGVAGAGVVFGASADTNLHRVSAAELRTDGTFHSGVALTAGANAYLAAASGDSQYAFVLTNRGAMSWGSGSAVADTNLYRSAADVLATDDSVEFVEQSSAPSAPAANKARLFAQDNGAGKTQLCVRFNTGATQVIATEP